MTPSQSSTCIFVFLLLLGEIQASGQAYNASLRRNPGGAATVAISTAGANLSETGNGREKELTPVVLSISTYQIETSRNTGEIKSAARNSSTATNATRQAANETEMLRSFPSGSFSTNRTVSVATLTAELDLTDVALDVGNYTSNHSYKKTGDSIGNNNYNMRTKGRDIPISNSSFSSKDKTNANENVSTGHDAAYSYKSHKWGGISSAASMDNPYENSDMRVRDSAIVSKPNKSTLVSDRKSQYVEHPNHSTTTKHSTPPRSDQLRGKDWTQNETLKNLTLNEKGNPENSSARPLENTWINSYGVSFKDSAKINLKRDKRNDRDKSNNDKNVNHYIGIKESKTVKNNNKIIHSNVFGGSADIQTYREAYINDINVNAFPKSDRIITDLELARFGFPSDRADTIPITKVYRPNITPVPPFTTMNFLFPKISAQLGNDLSNINPISLSPIKSTSEVKTTFHQGYTNVGFLERQHGMLNSSNFPSDSRTETFKSGIISAIQNDGAGSLADTLSLRQQPSYQTTLNYSSSSYHIQTQSSQNTNDILQVTSPTTYENNQVNTSTQVKTLQDQGSLQPKSASHSLSHRPIRPPGRVTPSLFDSHSSNATQIIKHGRDTPSGQHELVNSTISNTKTSFVPQQDNKTNTFSYRSGKSSADTNNNNIISNINGVNNPNNLNLNRGNANVISPSNENNLLKSVLKSSPNNGSVFSNSLYKRVEFSAPIDDVHRQNASRTHYTNSILRSTLGTAWSNGGQNFAQLSGIPASSLYGDQLQQGNRSVQNVSVIFNPSMMPDNEERGSNPKPTYRDLYLSQTKTQPVSTDSFSSDSVDNQLGSTSSFSYDANPKPVQQSLWATQKPLLVNQEWWPQFYPSSGSIPNNQLEALRSNILTSPVAGQSLSKVVQSRVNSPTPVSFNRTAPSLLNQSHLQESKSVQAQNQVNPLRQTDLGSINGLQTQQGFQQLGDLGLIKGMQNQQGFQRTDRGLITGMQNQQGFQRTEQGFINGIKNQQGLKKTDPVFVNGVQNQQVFQQSDLGLIKGMQNQQGFQRTDPGFMNGIKNQQGLKKTDAVFVNGVQNQQGFQQSDLGLINGMQNQQGFQRADPGSVNGVQNQQGFQRADPEFINGVQNQQDFQRADPGLVHGVQNQQGFQQTDLGLLHGMQNQQGFQQTDSALINGMQNRQGFQQTDSALINGMQNQQDFQRADPGLQLLPQERQAYKGLQHIAESTPSLTHNMTNVDLNPHNIVNTPRILQNQSRGFQLQREQVPVQQSSLTHRPITLRPQSVRRNHSFVGSVETISQSRNGNIWHKASEKQKIQQPHKTQSLTNMQLRWPLDKIQKSESPQYGTNIAFRQNNTNKEFQSTFPQSLLPRQNKAEIKGPDFRLLIHQLQPLAHLVSQPPPDSKQTTYDNIQGSYSNATQLIGYPNYNNKLHTTQTEQRQQHYVNPQQQQQRDIPSKHHQQHKLTTSNESLNPIQNTKTIQGHEQKNDNENTAHTSSAIPNRAHVLKYFGAQNPQVHTNPSRQPSNLSSEMSPFEGFQNQERIFQSSTPASPISPVRPNPIPPPLTHHQGLPVEVYSTTRSPVPHDGKQQTLERHPQLVQSYLRRSSPVTQAPTQNRNRLLTHIWPSHRTVDKFWPRKPTRPMVNSSRVQQPFYSTSKPNNIDRSAEKWHDPWSKSSELTALMTGLHQDINSPHRTRHLSPGYLPRNARQSILLQPMPISSRSDTNPGVVNGPNPHRHENQSPLLPQGFPAQYRQTGSLSVFPSRYGYNTFQNSPYYHNIFGLSPFDIESLQNLYNQNGISMHSNSQ
ncbi:collagen triple helix repeat (20 copies) [Elysia marginata]|uniref:Collagen triple helix repeat (20 copies) n=1 Tax=Elysia marginata TaxID=1093978 RepID=A0AAV4G2H3_9GAST|nr:collagen triple helix repeat (20 copies) [Elysia marginata]